MDPEIPAELYRWHDRIARLTGVESSGWLLLEVVRCAGHGDGEWTPELELTARLESAREDARYVKDIRTDWEVALSELQSGHIAGADGTYDVSWITGRGAAEVRVEFFD